MSINLIPGFSQPPSVWDRTRAALPAAARSVAAALDVPHGLDFVGTAAALGDAGGIGTYVGYSMGGRLALRLAVDRPDLVRALVLVSASPGIESVADRRARRDADLARAREIEALGVEQFLADWLAQPIFATVAPDATMAAARAHAMSVDRLQHQMTTLGQGAMEPLTTRLRELAMPVTIVVGRADARYSEIGGAMVERISTARLVELDGGHALPLEQPEALAAILATVHETAAHDTAAQDTAAHDATE